MRSMRFGSTTLIFDGQSTFIEGGITINGVRYSKDDPTAVERMPEYMHNIFWLSCSDKAKDHDLYREHAKKELAEVKVDIDKITDPEKKLLLLNNASHINSLGKYFIKKGNTHWVHDFLKLSPEQFSLFTNKSYDVTNLLEGLSQTGCVKPFNTLIDIPHQHLQLLLNKSYDTKELIKALYDIGYYNPILRLIKMTIPQLKCLFGNCYNVKQLLNALSDAGYDNSLELLVSQSLEMLTILIKQDTAKILKTLRELRYETPFHKLMVIQTDILQLMLEDCLASTDVLKKLFEIGYRDPLSRLLNLSKPEIKELFKNKYEACSFLETFKGFGYSDPLQSLFQLDYSMRILLYKNKYEATSIMTALNESSYVSKNPLEYLQVLGLSAMIQMFSDRYQYVKKIKAGEDLRLEFKETSNLGYRL